jgi:RES domain-containing protein
MQVFRIARNRYRHEILSGSGAALSRVARWNPYGTPMVYTSGSRSLAYLEMAAHLDWAEDAPSDRWLIELEIPENIVVSSVEKHELPLDWAQRPPSKSTQVLGLDFIRNGRTAVLRVPSAWIPEEFNYLINPMHPDAAQIRVKSERPLIAPNEPVELGKTSLSR